ncbi:PAAR domain-containing protein [Collimonas silvisoli]|uniref:PAAR domain-containing protein n=1 Tax=Collimonas silvisoli TaxID=2825884 RepID=UPI001B8B96BE|nr:PAAR domain-containing protein [Collimonas silvisoli]
MATITRSYLTVGDKADNGAVIMTGSRGMFSGLHEAQDGSQVFCPVCKTTGVLKCIGPRISNKTDGIEQALSGDICICKCPRSPVFLPARNDYTMTVDTNAAWCLHSGGGAMFNAISRPTNTGGNWINFVLPDTGSWHGSWCIAHFDDGTTQQGVLNLDNRVAFQNVDGKVCQKFEMSMDTTTTSDSVTDSILSTILG